MFGHFEKPLFFELCKYIETKFVPANALLFRPGQVSRMGNSVACSSRCGRPKGKGREGN